MRTFGLFLTTLFSGDDDDVDADGESEGADDDCGAVSF